MQPQRFGFSLQKKSNGEDNRGTVVIKEKFSVFLDKNANNNDDEYDYDYKKNSSVKTPSVHESINILRKKLKDDERDHSKSDSVCESQYEKINFVDILKEIDGKCSSNEKAILDEGKLQNLTKNGDNTILNAMKNPSVKHCMTENIPQKITDGIDVSKKCRYLDKLLISNKRRTLEKELIHEKILLKQRQLDTEKIGNKELFVTPSYAKILNAREIFKEEIEKKDRIDKNLLDRMLSRKNNAINTTFQRGLLNQRVALTSSSENIQNKNFRDYENKLENLTNSKLNKVKKESDKFQPNSVLSTKDEGKEVSVELNDVKSKTINPDKASIEEKKVVTATTSGKVDKEEKVRSAIERYKQRKSRSD